MPTEIAHCKCDETEGDNPNCSYHRELEIDLKRYMDPNVDTGIYVRAKGPTGKWESVDINALDKRSLLQWLRSRGGDNKTAEDVVGILLGHGHLHDLKPPQEKTS